MDNERYIAAIEIGSSKIIAAVGKTDGVSLDIIAVEQTKGVEIVRFGIIQNAEETANRIIDIIDRLEARPEIYPRKINSLFVSIAGRSMRAIPIETQINLAEESEITEEDIANLRHQAMSTAIDNSLKVIDVVPRNYKVGGNTTQSPRGVIGNNISATFDLIVCRSVLERNLRRTISNKVGIDVANIVVTPLAAGHVLVSAEEKRLGCMLVDIGAETTTVVIFKSGHLHYYATLPMGSRFITLDLTSLKILEERADQIKQVSGDALSTGPKSELNIDGIRLSDINNLVTARAEEIAANICEQIYYAGLTYADLTGGIIAMGGGFKLKNMAELVSKQCNLRIRTAKLPPTIMIEDAKAPEQDILQVTSVLYTAATHTDIECLKAPHVQELPDTGEPNTGTDDNLETPEKIYNSGKPPKKPHTSGRLQRIVDRIKGAITYSEDPDDPELE